MVGHFARSSPRSLKSQQVRPQVDPQDTLQCASAGRVRQKEEQLCGQAGLRGVILGGEALRGAALPSYYLSTESNCRSLAYRPKVGSPWSWAPVCMVRPMGGLGSHMVGLTQLHVLENNTHLLLPPTAPSGAPQKRVNKSEVSLCSETLLPAPALAWLMCTRSKLVRGRGVRAWSLYVADDEMYQVPYIS